MIAAADLGRPAVRFPTRFLVTGGARSGKSALTNRLVFDLVRADCGERQFASGASLADAVRRLVPEAVGEPRRAAFAHGTHAFLLDEPAAADDAELLAAACLAHGAILVVDATAGFTDDDAAVLLATAELRVPTVIVAVNKIDKVGFDYEAFRAVRTAVASHAGGLGKGRVFVAPVSAWFGFNVASRGDALDWVAEQSLLELLVAAAGRKPGAAQADA